jgi:uncharacterized surface protein with fasciclin (FAS1) repeats
MKNKYLTHSVLLLSMAALTTAAIAQDKPGTSFPETGNQGTGTPSTDQTTDRNTDRNTDRTTDRATDRNTDRTTDRNTTGENKSVRPGSLTTVIADGATFSTLTKALKATGLDVTLGGSDQFTIFAPTDEAFGKLPAETLTKLMLPENKEKLRMLLLNHVVAGKVLAADLSNGEVKTVNGMKLEVDVSSDKIEVEGAKVYSSDVTATNGVMHSIGKVLVPKSLDGFAGLKN